MVSPTQDDFVLARATAIEHKLKNLLQADMQSRLVRMHADNQSVVFTVTFRESEAGRRLVFSHFLTEHHIPHGIKNQGISISSENNLSSFLNALDKAIHAFEVSQLHQPASLSNRYALFTPHASNTSRPPTQLPTFVAG